MTSQPFVGALKFGEKLDGKTLEVLKMDDETKTEKPPAKKFPGKAMRLPRVAESLEAEPETPEELHARIRAMKLPETKVDPALRVATVAVVLVAAGVLIGASDRHSYSYYSMLRWLACSAAVLLVWRGAVQGVKWAWALVPLAILFNPVAPIHFSRNTWGTLDVAAAVVMVLAVAAMETAVLLRKVH